MFYGCIALGRMGLGSRIKFKARLDEVWAAWAGRRGPCPWGRLGGL